MNDLHPKITLSTVIYERPLANPFTVRIKMFKLMFNKIFNSTSIRNLASPFQLKLHETARPLMSQFDAPMFIFFPADPIS